MTNMRPVYDMLTAASARRSGHMPGHKGRPPFGAADLYALDTTELPNTDDLYAAEGGLRESMRLYAQAAGAAKTIFLHNGSTAGNHVMLQLYAREGETVLLPRNAHLSAVNACVLGAGRVLLSGGGGCAGGAAGESGRAGDAACPPGLLRRRDAGRCFPADCGSGASSRDESRCGRGTRGAFPVVRRDDIRRSA